MTRTEPWFRGGLKELTREECFELLASTNVGRFAYCSPEGPEVFPLNYVLQGESLLFRTSPHTTLGRRLPLAAAAFQIDDVDDYTETGWSVLIRGPVDVVEHDDLPPADERPEPWVGGLRPLHLRLSARAVTGRRVLPG
jgi:uncharacterized protein